MHGITGEVLFARLAEERKFLRHLEVDEPLYIIEERTAGKTQLISINGNRYSAPPVFARRRVRCRRYENVIEILDGNGLADWIELAKANRLSLAGYCPYPGKGSGLASTAGRIQGPCPIGGEVSSGARPVPCGHLREMQMESIAALTETYSRSEIEATMTRSREFAAYRCGRLKLILEKQRAMPESLPERCQKNR